MSDAEEIRSRAAETYERLSRQVSIKDDHIVINVAYEYNIPLSGCADLPSLMGWVLHLCEKTWMTLEVLERFILVASRHHGLDIKR